MRSCGSAGRASASRRRPAKPAFATRGTTTFATIDLGEDDYQLYYAGFANRSLWPLLHYRTGLVAYSREDYRGYRATNDKFAEALCRCCGPTISCGFTTII